MAGKNKQSAAAFKQKHKGVIAMRQSSTQSPLELQVNDILTRMGVDFVTESFHNSMVNPLTNKPLFFDFYIASLRLAIEIDGPQHHLPIFGEEKLKNQRQCDKAKNRFCASRGIYILRIKSTLHEKFEKIIKEHIADRTAFLINKGKTIENRPVKDYNKKRKRKYANVKVTIDDYNAVYTTTHK